MRHFIRTLAVLALAVPIIGCGGGSNHPPIAEVTGVVTKQGQPLVGARVEFYPVNNGAASYGQTDAQGKFELRYSTGGFGAAVDKHSVTIVGGSLTAPPVTQVSGGGAESPEGTLAPMADPEAMRSGPGTATGEIKGLTAEVTAEGPNVIQLAI